MVIFVIHLSTSILIISQKSGINDFLFDNAPVEQLLFHPDMDRLTVLPGRSPVSESAEMLASPKIVSLCEELSSRYPERIVIYDVAPVLSVDDALALAPNVDCMLMVAESGATSREDSPQVPRVARWDTRNWHGTEQGSEES